MKSVYKNSFLNLSSNIFGNFLFFLSFVIYSRVLGAELLGIFQLEYLILVVAPIILISFNDYALSYYIGKNNDQGEKDRYFTLSLITSYFIAIIFIVLIWLLKDFLFSHVFKISPEHLAESFLLLKYFLLYFFVQILLNIVKSLMLGLGEFEARFNLIFISRFFSSIFSVAFLVYFNRLSLISLGLFVGSLFALLYALFYLRKKSFKLRGDIGRESAVKFFHYGRATFLINLGTQTGDWLDSFFIAIFMSSDFVGVYAVAYNIFNQVIRFPKMLSESIFSKLAQGRDGQIGESLVRVRNLSFLIQTPLALLFLFFSKDIIFLVYGDTYVEATQVLSVLSIAILFSPFWVANMALLARKKAGCMAKAVLSSAALNVALNIFLIPSFGLLGAAWATVASFSFYYLLSNLYLSKIKM